MFYRMVLIALAVFAAGCSDPKAANEKNFKAAIQKSLDAEYPTCYVTANFPATIGGVDVGGNKANFKALVSAGLLSEKEEPHEVEGWGRNKQIVVQPTFYLTDEGKKFYKADGAKTIMGDATGGFCFGKATVKEITEFTEPADIMGMRASQVMFTYMVSDFPAWAKLPEMLAANHRLQIDVGSEKNPIQHRGLLALTNNGWVSK
jgi:hypothetical protein